MENTAETTAATNAAHATLNDRRATFNEVSFDCRVWRFCCSASAACRSGAYRIDVFVPSCVWRVLLSPTIAVDSCSSVQSGNPGGRLIVRSPTKGYPARVVAIVYRTNPAAGTAPSVSPGLGRRDGGEGRRAADPGLSAGGYVDSVAAMVAKLLLRK